MDDQARAIGRRVRYWRLRRNLDRQRFADLVGRSASWLDKVEKGERNLLRLPMLERVAEVLGVEPAVLLDGPTARRTAACVDAIEVQALRMALSRYPALDATTGPPVEVAQVQRQVSYLDHAWLSSHFTVVARHLPPLLHDAQVAVLTGPDADQLAARRTLVAAYRLSSSMLLKFETTDVAWLAADRAMHTALGADDTVALARATRSVARAMTGTGQQHQALAALIGMTDRMRPELPGREHELLALYGMLFLAAAMAAAGQEDDALALAMHQEADGRRPAQPTARHPLHRVWSNQCGAAPHCSAGAAPSGGRGTRLCRPSGPGRPGRPATGAARQLPARLDHGPHPYRPLPRRRPRPERG